MCCVAGPSPEPQRVLPRWGRAGCAVLRRLREPVGTTLVDRVTGDCRRSRAASALSPATSGVADDLDYLAYGKGATAPIRVTFSTGRPNENALSNVRSRQQLQAVRQVVYRGRKRSANSFPARRSRLANSSPRGSLHRRLERRSGQGDGEILAARAVGQHGSRPHDCPVTLLLAVAAFRRLLRAC